MGQKVRITETEEIPLSENVKLVRDVTEEPEPRERAETVKRTVTVEEKTVSRD